MPKVSVILTSYNHDKYINEAIDSVLKQNFTDFELIIWDDASCDSSWYLINQYTDARIKSFRNEIHLGPVFGINKAISEISTGDYIAIHHSDDIWDSDKLQKQVDFLDSNSEIGAVFSNPIVINQEGMPLTNQSHFYSHAFQQNNKTRYEWLRFFFMEGNDLCHSSILIRRKCYQECGLYRPIFAQVPDLDMWIRLCLKYEIYILPEQLVYFRLLNEEANSSGNRPETRTRGLYEYYKILSNYRNINSIDELVKIFPNAQKYYLSNQDNVLFPLAMIALEIHPFPFTVLFGLEILLELISDPEQSAQIKRFYHFDYLSFIDLTAKYDVFSREEIFNLWKDIATLNATVAERESAIVTLNNVVAERESAIVTLNNVVAERESAIVTLNNVVAERESAIVTLNNVVAERESAIVTLNNVVAERESAIVTLNNVVAERESAIVTLNNEVIEYQIKIAKLNKLLENRENAIIRFKKLLNKRDTRIAQLNQHIAEHHDHFNRVVNKYELTLHRLFNSSSWKISAPFRFLGHLIKGDFSTALRVISHNTVKIKEHLFKLEANIQTYIFEQCDKVISYSEVNNDPAINSIVMQRCQLTQQPLLSYPLSCTYPVDFPTVDISVVTYNSSRWINDFVTSLLDLNYPKTLLTIRFVDNSSTDSTLSDLYAIAPNLIMAGYKVSIMKRPNHGYGAGHNTALKLSTAPFCLVTNIDLTFEPDALTHIIAIAATDDNKVAAWEMRQKPYEHPKYYDPVTGLTNWNSHACVLLRHNALKQVGFYDDTLFMYGEDVELSYRLRQAGFLLRYCPRAVVWHYSYEDITKVKPLQYTGSTFANLYLRLKYGNPNEIKDVPWLGLNLLRHTVYPGSKNAVAKNLLRLLLIAPKVLITRKKNNTVCFPFRVWDYDLTRIGATIPQQALIKEPPLVSIITRTYRGRELYLRQALLSGIHQTYPNIEHIVVEDGGDTMKAVVDNINQVTGSKIRFIPLPKCGRSATGNAGLQAATGRWCLFLDDDDLLFAEHIETLATVLIEQTDIVAAYTPAWEIATDTDQLNQGQYSEESFYVPEALLQEFDFEVLKHHNYMAIQSILFERSLFEQRGGFEQDMDALEDWLLWLKYAIGNRFQYIAKVTSMYRTPAHPIVSAKRQEILNEAYAEAQKKLQTYLEVFK